MKHASLLLVATLAAGVALAASPPPETPLIEDKGVSVTVLDFDAALERIPEHRRVEVKASHERIMTLLDTTYVARQLAAKAKAAGLDKNALVQKRIEQAVDALLADIYMNEVERTAKLPDLEVRARELYRVNAEKFRSEEHVYIQHILVGLNGRTKEMAAVRAKELRAELDTGKEDFLDMAKRLSDDPDKKRNGGDLGWLGLKGLDPAIAKATTTMKKNEISQPIETQYGYHIVRYIDRRPSEAVPFEQARRPIINEERERIIKERRENAVKEIRDSSTVLVHRDKIEALRIDVDMSKAARERAVTPPKK